MPLLSSIHYNRNLLEVFFKMILQTTRFSSASETYFRRIGWRHSNALNNNVFEICFQMTNKHVVHQSTESRTTKGIHTFFIHCCCSSDDNNIDSRAVTSKILLLLYPLMSSLNSAVLCQFSVGSFTWDAFSCKKLLEFVRRVLLPLLALFLQ